MSDVHYLTATELTAAYGEGTLRPTEVVEAMLARIDELDDRVCGYSSVLEASALRQARAAEEEMAGGGCRGPLHGVPVAVKDLCDIAGEPTLAGTTVLGDNVAATDATAVRRLREAGAVIMGKLNLTEGAMAGYHPDRPVPINPWGDDRWAGVSSSGSGAATAAGLCVASLGSDTGGSIRFPAAANGLVGIKPTYGLVSRHGVWPLAESLDHVGPLARCVADAAAVLDAIAGPDDDDPTTIPAPAAPTLDTIDSGVAGLRIGLDRRYIAPEGAHQGTVDAVLDAVATLVDLGVEVVEVEVPDFPDDAWFTICAAEAALAHQAFYPSRADEYGPYLREFLAVGVGIQATGYARASAQRREFSGRLERVFAEVDAIACPSMNGPAFVAPATALRGSIAEVHSLAPALDLRFTGRFDMSGSPTISLLSGFDPEGMPLSVQFVGRHREEALLCRIGYAYEQATDWHLHHP